MSESPAAERAAARTRRLLACGAAVGPLFVGSFLVEGARRPGYRHIRHPVSSLALGPGGWRQILNFAVSGGLCLGFAAGLEQAGLKQAGLKQASLNQAGLEQLDDAWEHRRLGSTLIGAAGIGLIGAGLFVTDPFNGYPLGTPDTPEQVTRAGQMHDLSAALILVSMPAAQLLYARRFAQRGHHSLAVGSAATALTMITGAALARAGFAQNPRFAARAGLFQKVSVIAGFAWGTALALRQLRTQAQR